jgi:AcrR family transcriptional regulator
MTNVTTEASTVGLRERKKARTREAIIDAAVDLFERTGYDDTTVQQIAVAAEVSERTFFRYFDSKLDVVLALKEEDENIEALVATRPADESPLEATRQVVRARMAEAFAGDDLIVRQFRVVMGTPSLRSFAMEHFNEHRDGLAAAFAQRLGVDERDLAPQIIATAVGGALWTVIDRWVEEGAQTERLVPLVDEAFRLLERGLG